MESSYKNLKSAFLKQDEKPQALSFRKRDQSLEFFWTFFLLADFSSLDRSLFCLLTFWGYFEVGLKYYSFSWGTFANTVINRNLYSEKVIKTPYGLKIEDNFEIKIYLIKARKERNCTEIDWMSLVNFTKKISFQSLVFAKISGVSSEVNN